MLQHYILLLLGCIISAENQGLQLTDVVIPRYADLRQPAILSCNFDLAGGQLYSVKWYKDEWEFFRYMPENTPAIQTFPLEGVNLDLSQSNISVVTLQPLTFNSSGAYRCEVSTDGPNFETVVRNGNMTVIVLPDGDPIIDGIQQFYKIEDYLTGNCTSPHSNPVAELSWYINNEKAEKWLLQTYPVQTYPGPVYETALGLSFQIAAHHFGPKERLEIRCRAKISDLGHWERVVVVRPSSHNQKPAPDRYRNNANGIVIEEFSRVFVVVVSLLLVNNN